MTDGKVEYLQLKSDPLADPLFQISHAARKAKIVTKVIEVGIFDDIEVLDNAVTVDQLAMRRKYNREVTERLLNALVCFKLLEKSTTTETCTYHNSPTTRKYLLQSKTPSMLNSLASEFDMMMPIMGTLPMALKKGTNDQIFQDIIRGNVDENLNNLQIKDEKTHKVEDKQLDQNKNMVSAKLQMTPKPKQPSPVVFMSLMDGMIAPSLPAIATAFNLSAHTIMLDLGGSSGILAYAFVKEYPQMKAIVFDIPETIQLARTFQPEQTKSQVKFVAGDFFTCQIPDADLIVLSHVIHNWSKDKVDIILHKVFSTLPPGGCILLAEKLLDDDKTGPESCVLLDMAMAVVCEGRERTPTEYKALLETQGFRNIKCQRIGGVNVHDAIIGHKPF